VVSRFNLSRYLALTVADELVQGVGTGIYQQAVPPKLRQLVCFDICISKDGKMHQHPRQSPMTASPASSPRTNPTRTNNPREEGAASHSRSGSDMPGYNEADEGSGDSGVIAPNGPSKDAVKKLDQIIQVS
jgi:hypothetical protein